MRSFVLCIFLLLPFTLLTGQKKIELGAVSISNSVLQYNYEGNRRNFSDAGFSLGAQGSYFFNDRISIKASLLYTKLDYAGLMLIDCITIPGSINSNTHNHIELFTSIRYYLLKNKWVNPYVSAGFVQGSRSGKYIYIDFGDDFETTNRQVHFSYNYGAIASVGASIQLGNMFSIDLEGSVRNYVKRPSAYSPQTFFSPSFALNYRIQ
jgi:outer membrane protein W